MIKLPDQDIPIATNTCLMVKDGKYAQLGDILLERRVVELVDTKPIKINGLFGVNIDETNERLILDARRANYYFAAPDDPQMPHSSPFTELLRENTEEI